MNVRSGDVYAYCTPSLYDALGTSRVTVAVIVRGEQDCVTTLIVSDDGREPRIANFTCDVSFSNWAKLT